MTGGVGQERRTPDKCPNIRCHVNAGREKEQYKLSRKTENYKGHATSSRVFKFNEKRWVTAQQNVRCRRIF
jgi:hypothetical protein